MDSGRGRALALDDRDRACEPVCVGRLALGYDEWAPWRQNQRGHCAQLARDGSSDAHGADDLGHALGAMPVEIVVDAVDDPY